MITRRIAIGLMAAAIVLPALSACGSTDTFRYKMTVEVETPEGVKTGYAVREIVQHRPPNIPMLGEDRGSTSVIGEAVAVDIAPGKTLFALLTGRDGYVDYAGSGVAAIFRVMGAARPGIAPHELWPMVPVIDRPHTDPMPMLVTFGDMADPTTIARVDPDDLAATFGEGVTLRRITVQQTDDPVTTGVEERLGWLGEYRNISFAGNRYSIDSSLQDTLRAGAFVSEIAEPNR